MRKRGKRRERGREREREREREGKGKKRKEKEKRNEKTEGKGKKRKRKGKGKRKEKENEEKEEEKGKKIRGWGVDKQYHKLLCYKACTTLTASNTTGNSQVPFKPSTQIPLTTAYRPAQEAQEGLRHLYHSQSDTTIENFHPLLKYKQFKWSKGTSLPVQLVYMKAAFKDDQW